jgi:hypothetical protein
MALADGQVTDKEREIILLKAEKLGLDFRWSGVGFRNTNKYKQIDCVENKDDLKIIFISKNPNQILGDAEKLFHYLYCLAVQTAMLR